MVSLILLLSGIVCVALSITLGYILAPSGRSFFSRVIWLRSYNDSPRTTLLRVLSLLGGILFIAASRAIDGGLAIPLGLDRIMGEIERVRLYDLFFALGIPAITLGVYLGLGYAERVAEGVDSVAAELAICILKFALVYPAAVVLVALIMAVIRK